MKKEYDIVIAGAGPAGVSAAYFSKLYDDENKHKVLLLEKLSGDKYDVYHNMCGGCISQDAFTEIKPIKPKYVVENLHLSKEYIVDEFVLEHKIRGYIIDRPRFLRHIIEEFKDIGGEFQKGKVKEMIQEKRVVKLKVDDDRIIRTKYLIAADGVNSFVRKLVGFGEIRTVPAVQYVMDEEPEHGVIKFFYDEKYKGDYKWIFPYGKLTKIGFPYVGDNNILPKKTVEKHFRLIGYGKIPEYVKGNILLVGDAAGQSNPLSKGGIRSGMYAGKKAAESLIIYKDPMRYEIDWKNSIFYSEKMMEVFEKIKKMSNREIVEHLEPFKGNKILAFIKINLIKKYRKYLDIYRAYHLEQKIGW